MQRFKSERRCQPDGPLSLGERACCGPATRRSRRRTTPVSFHTEAPRAFSEAEEAQARENLARAVGYSQMVRFFAGHTVQRIKSTRLLDRQALDAAIDRGRHSTYATAMCQPIVVAHD